MFLNSVAMNALHFIATHSKLPYFLTLVMISNLILQFINSVVKNTQKQKKKLYGRFY